MQVFRGQRRRTLPLASAYEQWRPDERHVRDDRVTVFVQAMLFLSSYSPLLAVFGLLDTFGRGAPSIVCASLAIVGVAMLPLFFLLSRSTSPGELSIASATPRDGDVLAYVATYLVPFASVNAVTARERLAVGVFLGLIAVLYVRSELFFINPLLALLGFRVFAVQTPVGTPVVLLSRQRFLRAGSEIEAIRVSDYVWRERKP